MYIYIFICIYFCIYMYAEIYIRMCIYSYKCIYMLFMALTMRHSRLERARLQKTGWTERRTSRVRSASTRSRASPHRTAEYTSSSSHSPSSHPGQGRVCLTDQPPPCSLLKLNNILISLHGQSTIFSHTLPSCHSKTFLPIKWKCKLIVFLRRICH